MRNRFEQQLTLGILPIEEVKMPTKMRGALPGLLKGLQYIYLTKELNEKICKLLKDKICKGKKATGRRGMSLWEIFVLAQVRLCLGISYDDLHYLANYDDLLRGVLGASRSDFTPGREYGYQNIYDNVTLLDDLTLKDINAIIIEAGHKVFKKKETEALSIKADSFVVESNVHFPTDVNLLWDSGRKCIDVIEFLIKEDKIAGWRKSKNWKKELKKGMRELSRACWKGSKNKEERIKSLAESYLKKARALLNKVIAFYVDCKTAGIVNALGKQQLDYFYQMLEKHIDLVERRLIKGEKIPHEEKVFSIFQQYTEWITKGKLHPNVELGKKLLIATDQYDLIVDWQLAEKQADNQLTIGMADRLLGKYDIQSLSLDKGFSDKEDKELLELYIPEVIMPKKGRKNQSEKQQESTPGFIKLKKQHSAIESNINELEHRGLNRCPDKSYYAFKRYVGLGIVAYNLTKIGKELLRQQRKEEEKKKAAQLRIAA